MMLQVHLQSTMACLTQIKPDQGSVLGMTCSDNLVFTTRSIAVNGTTFINNGSANSLSMFSFCGQPSVTFTANTLTKEYCKYESREHHSI